MDYTEYLEEICATKTHNTYCTYRNALNSFPNGTRREVVKLLANKSISDSTKQLKMTVLINALEWYGADCKDIKRLAHNFKPNQKEEPCPTDQEFEMVWNSFSKTSHKLALALMAYNGLRVSEVAKLTFSSVIDKDRLMLKNTKGKRDAIIPIVHPRVKELFEIRLKEKHRKSDSLIGIGLEGLKSVIRGHCLALDLPYHSHSFRRYFANTLKSRGVPIEDIQACMRHSSINTTRRYINIGQEDVRNIMQNVFGTTA